MTSNKDLKFADVVSKGVIDEANNKLIGVIGSTGAIDRYGEKVNPMGWQLDNFLKNPVILYGHDYSALPVGKADRVYIEDNALKFDITFGTTQFAKDVFTMFKDKILNAFSVGFIPKKWGTASVDEYDIMEQELLELSVVTVPANPEALALIKSMESKYDIKKKDGEPEEVKPVDPSEEVPPEGSEPPVTTDTPVIPEGTEGGETPSEEVKPTEEVKPVEETKPEGDEPKEEVPPVSSEPEVADQPAEPKDDTPAPEDKDAKALALLREVAALFKKADNATGQGLAILKQLKKELDSK